jgi:hypothetical protein
MAEATMTPRSTLTTDHPRFANGAIRHRQTMQIEMPNDLKGLERAREQNPAESQEPPQ